MGKVFPQGGDNVKRQGNAGGGTASMAHGARSGPITVASAAADRRGLLLFPLQGKSLSAMPVCRIKAGCR